MTLGSQKVSTLKKGQTVDIFEAIVIEGVLRLHCPEGWCSVISKGGQTLMKQRSRETAVDHHVGDALFKSSHSKHYVQPDPVVNPIVMSANGGKAHYKRVVLPGPDYRVSPIPHNPQQKGWTDKFEVEIDQKDGVTLTVRRIDKSVGWGQNLELLATPPLVRSHADQEPEPEDSGL